MADFTAGIRKAKVQEAIRSKIQLHFQGNEETTPAPWRCHCIATPDQFYKGRSQEKTLLPRLEVFLLLSPYDRARVVRTYRPMCSVAGHCGPAVWVFSTSGFHRFLATKPVCSETSKAERGQIWRPWFYPGLVAHSFDCITMSAPSTVHCGCMTTIGSE